MKQIKAKTAGGAWLKACHLVFSQGDEIYDDGIPLKEVLDLFLEIENGTKRDLIIKKYADLKMISWMVNENFYGTTPVLDWGYCYGMRLRNYNGVNQIKEIITNLKKKPETKAATIVTVKPEQDFKEHMPCIVVLDFKIRKGKLFLTGFFRSQDVGKKMYADILAMGKIQNEVAKKLKVKLGSLKIFISSAHIYETDFDKVRPLLAVKPDHWNA